MARIPTKKVKQAQRICAKLQTKVSVLRKRWRPSDRRRWDMAIAVIQASRQRD